MPPQPSLNRERTSTWRASTGPIHQYVRHWTQGERARASHAEPSLSVPSAYFGRLKSSLSTQPRGAWQPETFPKTATYCHLLPFWSLKTAKSVAFLSVPLALGRRTGKPEIRAWNRERAERGLRWNGAIECRVSHECAGCARLRVRD